LHIATAVQYFIENKKKTNNINKEGLRAKLDIIANIMCQIQKLTITIYNLKLSYDPHRVIFSDVTIN